MQSNRSPANRPSPTRQSALISLLLVFLVTTLAIGFVATPVAAHAYLSDTDPVNGEQVDTLPEEVTLYFSGDGVVTADISIEDPDGEVISEEPEIDPVDSQVVRVPIGDAEDQDGMYTVSWEVLAEDGHTTAGSFFFAVGDEPLDRDTVREAYDSDDEDESIPPFEAGSKALLIIGVVGLIGIPSTAAFAAGPVFSRMDGPSRETIDQRALRLLTGVAMLTVVSAVVLGLTRSTALGSLGVGTVSAFVETPLGAVWLAQVALSVLLVASVASVKLGLIGRLAGYVGALLGGLGMAGTIAWTSHSATAIDRLSGTVIDFVHIVGAGLWIGGLAVLAFAVVPVVKTARRSDRHLLAGVIRRFSILALIGVTLVVSSGFTLASWHAPTGDGLFGTVYGFTLVTKLVLVAGALMLGGVTRFVLLKRLIPEQSIGLTERLHAASTDGGLDRLPGDGPRIVSWISHSMRLEVGLLVAVLLLSGVLTSAPTAAVVTAAEGPSEAIIEYEHDPVTMEIVAFPAVERESGDDRFVLNVDEPVVFEVTFLKDGSPVESDRTVRLLAHAAEGTQFEVELEATDDGSYATVQPLAVAGEWELRVTGEPGGSYVSQWVDVTTIDSGGVGDEEAQDQREGDDEQDEIEGHDHAGHHHGHGDVPASPLQALFQFGAIATLVLGVLAVTIEFFELLERDSS
ncbi:copper resistance CopC/CopD family protein [Halorubrum vacuolatum]|uniref:Copper transport protein n=1 Tax=Halorubrum vacuolatum TaxID=63740 RepID=A0A238Y3W4_HALVU|nr:FixH family protein [Halorubrum vacuolatum]SNR65244.1 copper transport protein [Halorubrum vacuolatum]